ncbi:MAG: nitrogen fixation protein NifQ [Gammaproteobacteria bacterium]|nr:MAG: nitrogen fixation protein NifQ [Gammaproteobacteria bacterium]
MTSSLAVLPPTNYSLTRHEALQQNLSWLALLVTRQRDGEGCLPMWLGLAPLEFQQLISGYFPDQRQWLFPDKGNLPAGIERGQLRQQLLELRREEWLELRDLLLGARSGYSELETYMANIVAAGCLGGDHLWRDLGLPSRAALRELLMLNFAPLAQTNHADMKWKKFFYKQLCEQQGGYVCRAPSCQECKAYDDCFGAED